MNSPRHLPWTWALTVLLLGLPLPGFAQTVTALAATMSAAGRTTLRLPEDQSPRGQLFPAEGMRTVAEQILVVRQLGDTLEQAELRVLYDFLKTGPGETTFAPPGIHALKNEIMNALRRQTSPPAAFTEVLVGIYENAEQDGVVRDYALQHLAAWSEAGAGGNAGNCQQIQRVLLKAAAGRTVMAGTALLGLHRQVTSASPRLAAELETLALSLAVSEQAPAASRMAALQVCAERGVRDVLPVAETLARSPDNLPLQLSAIAVLGQLGNSEHAAWLRQVNGEAQEPLRTATGAALKRLSQKSAVLSRDPKHT